MLLYVVPDIHIHFLYNTNTLPKCHVSLHHVKLYHGCPIVHFLSYSQNHCQYGTVLVHYHLSKLKPHKMLSVMFMDQNCCWNVNKRLMFKLCLVYTA